MTAKVRNGFDDLPLWQGVVVMVELSAAAAVVLRIAVRLFRFSSISCTSRGNLRTALPNGGWLARRT